MQVESDDKAIKVSVPKFCEYRAPGVPIIGAGGENLAMLKLRFWRFFPEPVRAGVRPEDNVDTGRLWAASVVPGVPGDELGWDGVTAARELTRYSICERWLRTDLGAPHRTSDAREWDGVRFPTLEWHYMWGDVTLALDQRDACVSTWIEYKLQ